ncbi:DNA alkylation repair protein [uncultured Cohaesibacter sp.]|uniref:DNA alkylation repair protein n=1 Tax=uncultured Cohaesibacter sp. TaxID=1002546 RepID=UPI0029C9B219|nr:DNA alkylation repair protein [uncultured Cohaesibacter sp.]
MQHSQICQEALTEIEAALLAEGQSISPHKAAERAFCMKTPMAMIGLSVPQQRARLKVGYSFSHLDFEEQLPIWTHVWNAANYHEAKMQAAFFVERPNRTIDPVWLWDQLVPWVASVNCWDQSDTLSDVLSHLNERIPDHTAPTLERWNVSEQPWERRQSLVALLFYSRLRESFPEPELVFRLVECRLGDPDYYVQKAVGWTLREAYHVWPEEAVHFLDRHVGVLAPAAWQAATEKLPAKTKQVLKAKRKAGREKS